MERLYVSDVFKSENDNEILLKGWVHRITNLGQITFVRLRDKTGIVQLVFEGDQADKLRLEACISVTGKKVANPKAPGGIEIIVDTLDILGKTYYEMLPLEINNPKFKATLENQLDYRSISLRIPKQRAVFRIQEEIEGAFKDFLQAQNFSQIHTPKIIASGTEGGSEMFTVHYFDKRTFLAQSPQFYKQMMVGAGFERVFEIGHAYRAELHNTWRHLNEYVSLDVEMAFIESEEDLMDLEEDLLNYIIKRVRENCAKELEMHGVTLPESIKIPRMTLKEAQDLLLEKFEKKSPVGNIDAEGEVILSKYVKEQFNSDFVFLTKYPVSKRPMYTMPDEKDPEYTKSFDLIYKGLEITTGGQRIHDYEMLVENIKKFGMKTEDFKFYTDTFKYGMPPHGGLAIGLERLTMKILDLSNIREASLLPRDMKRITP